MNSRIGVIELEEDNSLAPESSKTHVPLHVSIHSPRKKCHGKIIINGVDNLAYIRRLLKKCVPSVPKRFAFCKSNGKCVKRKFEKKTQISQCLQKHDGALKLFVHKILSNPVPSRSHNGWSGGVSSETVLYEGDVLYWNSTRMLFDKIEVRITLCGTREGIIVRHRMLPQYSHERKFVEPPPEFVCNEALYCISKLNNRGIAGLPFNKRGYKEVCKALANTVAKQDRRFVIKSSSQCSYKMDIDRLIYSTDRTFSDIVLGVKLYVDEGCFRLCISKKEENQERHEQSWQNSQCTTCLSWKDARLICNSDDIFNKTNYEKICNSFVRVQYASTNDSTVPTPRRSLKVDVPRSLLNGRVTVFTSCKKLLWEDRNMARRPTYFYFISMEYLLKSNKSQYKGLSVPTFLLRLKRTSDGNKSDLVVSESQLKAMARSIGKRRLAQAKPFQPEFHTLLQRILSRVCMSRINKKTIRAKPKFVWRLNRAKVRLPKSFPTMKVNLSATATLEKEVVFRGSLPSKAIKILPLVIGLSECFDKMGMNMEKDLFETGSKCNRFLKRCCERIVPTQISSTGPKVFQLEMLCNDGHEMYRAAQAIQKQYRRRYWSKKVSSEKTKKHEAAIMLQSIQRARIEQASFRSLKRQREEDVATRKIQAVVRGRRERKTALNMKRRNSYAAEIPGQCEKVRCESVPDGFLFVLYKQITQENGNVVNFDLDSAYFSSGLLLRLFAGQENFQEKSMVKSHLLSLEHPHLKSAKHSSNKKISILTSKKVVYETKTPIALDGENLYHAKLSLVEAGLQIDVSPEKKCFDLEDQIKRYTQVVQSECVMLPSYTAQEGSQYTIIVGKEDVHSILHEMGALQVEGEERPTSDFLLNDRHYASICDRLKIRQMQITDNAQSVHQKSGKFLSIPRGIFSMKNHYTHLVYSDEFCVHGPDHKKVAYFVRMYDTHIAHQKCADVSSGVRFVVFLKDVRYHTRHYQAIVKEEDIATMVEMNAYEHLLEPKCRVKLCRAILRRTFFHENEFQFCCESNLHCYEEELLISEARYSVEIILTFEYRLQMFTRKVMEETDALDDSVDVISLTLDEARNTINAPNSFTSSSRMVLNCRKLLSCLKVDSHGNVRLYHKKRK